MHKVLKTTIYVAISAAAGFLIAATTDTPEMFGAYAPFINIALVAIKQFADNKTI